MIWCLNRLFHNEYTRFKGRPCPEQIDTFYLAFYGILPTVVTRKSSCCMGGCRSRNQSLPIRVQTKNSIDLVYAAKYYQYLNNRGRGYETCLYLYLQPRYVRN